MKKGDLVLIPFPFTDLSGNKLRPAVILVDSQSDVLVSFLTTQLHRQDQYDLLLEPTFQNGLKKTSLIKLGKIATLDKSLIIGRLGDLTKGEIDKLNINLQRLLKL